MFENVPLRRWSSIYYYVHHVKYTYFKDFLKRCGIAIALGFRCKLKIPLLVNAFDFSFVIVKIEVKLICGQHSHVLRFWNDEISISDFVMELYSVQKSELIHQMFVSKSCLCDIKENKNPWHPYNFIWFYRVE